LEAAAERTHKEHFTFYLPHDVVVAKSEAPNSATRVVDLFQHSWSDITAYPRQPEVKAYTIQADEAVFDIGPMSAAAIAGALKLAGTSIWNGTSGMAEVKGINGAADPFGHGSKVLAEAMVGANGNDKNKPFSLVGGGDTTSFVMSQESLAERFSYISTGGGATLELMAGKKLPGIEALLDKKG